MIISIVLVALGILFMFWPIGLYYIGYYNEDIFNLMYLTIPIGVLFIGIVGIVNSYKRNKRIDLNFKHINLKLEENPKQHYIKDEDKKFLIDNIEKFEEQIGNGKSYYINAFLKKKTPFNRGAFLGGAFWLGYRGLFKEFFALIVLFIIFDIVIFILGINIGNFNIGIVTSSVCGILGNYCYFLKLRRDIEKERKPIHPLKGLSISIVIFVIYIVTMEILI